MTLSQAAKMGLNPAELLEYRDVKAKFLPLLIAEAMASLNALIMDKRFVSQKKYAEYHGYHSKAIARLANKLKRQGIAKGEGRQARYDKTFRPDGTRLEEYESLPVRKLACGVTMHLCPASLSKTPQVHNTGAYNEQHNGCDNAANAGRSISFAGRY